MSSEKLYILQYRPGGEIQVRLYDRALPRVSRDHR
jgi:hypothetical protein